MPRPFLFAAALLVGFGYMFADHLVSGSALIVWKGAGVALLALWAATQARSADGWLLTLAFATYATADVVLEFGTVAGAVTFIVGHLLMIALYLRNRSVPLNPAAPALLVAVPLLAFLLARDVAATCYAAILGATAVAALASRFRRDRVLLGALLFVASDLLIFGRMGVLRDSLLPELGIWPLYFAGQALVVGGVGAGLADCRG